MATAGKLERISKNKVLRALKSFPVTICPALIRVVSIRSKVCRSRSPLIAEAVTAGTININRINSMDVTYGTLTAVVAGTYFLNRFALSVSGMDLQRSAAYVLGESSAKASSGGFFYLFLLNPAVTFMAVIGGQAGRGTPLADIVSYFGIPENGFIIKHWIGFSILIQLAAGMALINRAIHFVEPIKHKKTSRKGKK